MQSLQRTLQGNGKERCRVAANGRMDKGKSPQGLKVAGALLYLLVLRAFSKGNTSPSIDSTIGSFAAGCMSCDDIGCARP